MPLIQLFIDVFIIHLNDAYLAPIMLGPAGTKKGEKPTGFLRCPQPSG